ncbi:cyanophycinase [Crocosphaera sp. UHCC 0190]|uniref:cyanophycinase n=1 Tax=Crocosphaera sp. UHCC 0190 TaxID=3110246 RepID=UPI002B1F3ECE|nr:cyanophycinase [Crocosphaera sp. UHCC 0190]MEA5509387.1 cyanophycinase [Crocosphaera sp. UHCC 0190]
MESTKGRGKLVIIGGAEDKEGDCKILREFVRAAGGTDAKIAILTAATSEPRESGEDYIRVFERLGVEEVTVLNTIHKDDGDDPKNLEILENATGAFFTGGDQARILEYIKGTKLDSLLHQRHKEGMVIGGTSAGAAMMPDLMIVEGDSETNPRMDAIEMGEGMGFIHSVVIDQHFAQRGRLGRLVSALLQQPANLGFGIDEDTAMIVDGDELTVVGRGAVTVVDESDATYNNLDELLKDEAMAVCGVKLHILPQGFRFNLKTRKPISLEISKKEAESPVLQTA